MHHLLCWRRRLRFVLLRPLVLLGACLVCMFGWAEQATNELDLASLAELSLAEINTAYQQPRPEFVCGGNAKYEYPQEFRRRPQAAVVDLNFTRTAAGYARDYYVTREKHPAFSREAIKYLRQCRFAPLPEEVYGAGLRLLFSFSSNERGTTLYLRKLKRSARKGTPGRKRFYAYNLELATSFDKISRSDEANRWYVQAAELGDAKAQYQVGVRMFYGRGFKQDTTLGLSWLERAAMGGNGDANFALAQMRIDGPQPSSTMQRLDYLRAAAEVGHLGAALLLAQELLAQELLTQEPSPNPVAIEPASAAEIAALLETSKAAWDRERWLLVAARFAMATGKINEAKARVAVARRYVTEIGHPLTDVELMEVELQHADELNHGGKISGKVIPS